MDPFRLSSPAVSEQLFNVVETYSQALNALRAKRNEPLDGIARQAWTAKQWVKQNRWGTAGSAIILFVAVSSILFLSSRTWKQKKNIEMWHELEAA